MARARKKDPQGATDDGADGSFLPQSLIASIDPARPKTAQVHGIMRRAIVNLHLVPGSIVDEKLLCDQFGISRTPLREAILPLQAENLVSVVPNSGTYISKIDLQLVLDGQLVREAQETRIVRLAANRMTPQFERTLDFNMHQQDRMAADLVYERFYKLDDAFHMMIYEFGASAYVWRMINSAKAQLDRVRRMFYPLVSHLEVVLQEHGNVVDGLKRRDPDAATAAMKVHVDRVFTMIRRLNNDRRDYFAADAVEALNSYESGG